jgi:protein-disulfide isomerase
MKKLSVVVCLLLGAACQRSSGEEQQALKTLVSKVESIEKKLDAMQAGGRGGAVANPAARAAQPARPDPATVYALPIRDDEPYLGAKHAKVTIVDAVEFACPHCAKIAPVLHEVATARASDVKVVSRQLIIHPDIATLPALASCAAGKQSLEAAARFEQTLWGKAWSKEMRMDASALAPEALDKIAGEVGLDLARFKTDVAGPECKGALEENRKAFNAIGVRGTPWVFLNGRPYVGPRTTEALLAAVDAEIKRVDEAIAKGGRVDEYYTNLMKTAKKSL